MPNMSQQRGQRRATGATARIPARHLHAAASALASHTAAMAVRRNNPARPWVRSPPIPAFANPAGCVDRNPFGIIGVRSYRPVDRSSLAGVLH